MSYDWIKALHVISVIAWMAGMLYLPRLFVYHASAKPGSELSETLKLMERRLLRGIINPAMIAAWVFGIWMLALNPALLHEGFMHVKLGMVILMQIVHALCARARRQFADDRNTRSARFYRILNEVPAALIVGIVIMIIVRPISAEIGYRAFAASIMVNEMRADGQVRDRKKCRFHARYR